MESKKAAMAQKEFVITITGNGKNLSIQIRNQDDLELLDTLIEWVKTKVDEAPNA